MNTPIYSARASVKDFRITISKDDVHLYAGTEGMMLAYKVLRGMFPFDMVPCITKVNIIGDYAEVIGQYLPKSQLPVTDWHSKACK